jgi:hypothetical protein
MLAERPDHRPSTAGAFAQALCAALESAPPDEPATVATAVTLMTPPPATPATPSAHAPAPAPTTVVPQPAEARPPRPSDDAPPPEALAEFARQGTFWEPPRRGDDAETATIAMGSVPSASSAVDDPPNGSVGRPDLHAADAGRRGGPTVSPLDPLLRLDHPEPAPTGAEPGPADSLLFSTFGAAADHTPASEAALAEPVSHTPPLVVLALTLGLGLAVGAAGGYLVGVRSGERAAQRALGGVTTEPTFPNEPAASPPAGPVSERTPPATAARTPSAAASTPSPAAAPAPATAPATAPPPTSAVTPATEPRTRRVPAATGQLTVHSTPARAGVLIDGVWRGRTPLTLKDLAVGTHGVRVVEDGYIAEARRVAIDARAAATTVSFQLGKVRGPERPAAAAARPGVTTGRLLLESRPSGAAVLIDGSVVGTTPLLLSDLGPGPRQIRIELPGHKPWTTTATVVAGQRVRVAASLEENTDR